MEPMTAQMPDTTLVWMGIIIITLLIGFVAAITKNT